MLSHPYEQQTFKLGCSTNIAQRLKSGDYSRMFLPENKPVLQGWFSVDGYVTFNEVRFLEQSIFHQLKHKRLSPDRELFKDVTFDEIVDCISNLQLIPHSHTDIPADTGIKVKKRVYSDDIKIRDFQVPILVKMKNYFDEHNRGKLILPCGYGKMYLALFLIKEKFNTAIIACPTLLLCQQFEALVSLICPERASGIIVTTYHSIDKYKDYNPELLIVDEAHHTCVTSKSPTEESLFRSLLIFPAKKYLFMTATEKVLKQDDDEICYSMDNVELYGHEIEKKNFSEAIEDGIISDYRLVVVNSGDPISVVVKARQTLGIKWLLTYHHSCESAKNFCEQLNLNDVPAFYIDGKMNMEQRNLVLKDFENTPYSVLCSVDVLSEGISLPFIDSTYFVDSRSSEIDVIQRVGRCLRLHKDKSLATIILSENIFQYVALLRSLVIYDVNLTLSKKVVGIGFSKINSNINEFDDITTNLNICIMGKLQAQWEATLQLCMNYEKTGRLITKNIIYTGVNIGQWINNMKAAINGKKSYAMNNERLEKLFELNTIQKWHDNYMNDSKWLSKWQLCIDYEKEKNIIVESTIYMEIRLGTWLLAQKQALFRTGGYAMNNERHNKLFELSTIKEWYKNINFDYKWLSIWQACMEYEKVNGIIVQTIIYNNIHLGQWISDNKKALRGKGEHKMNDERLCKLFELLTIKEWHKNSTEDYKWMTKYQVCLDYESSGFIIEAKTKYENVQIGVWIGNQKKSIGSDTYGGVMNERRLTYLLKSRTFYNWYIKNQNKCLPEFQGFHLKNNQ